MTSIRQKMIIACIAIFVLVVGSGLVSIWVTRQLSASSAELSRITQILHNHMRADMMHDAIRADVFKGLLVNNKLIDQPMSEVKKELDEHLANFHDAIADNARLSVNPEIRAQLGQLDMPLKEYGDAAGRIFQTIEAGGDSSAQLQAFVGKFLALEKAMDNAGDAISKVSQDVHLQDAALVSRVQLMLDSIVVIGLLFSVALIFLTTRLVTRPILSLARDMGLIAGGDTDLICEGLGRRDEIGEMAGAVELFRKGAIERKRLEREADDNRAKSEADRIRVQAEAEAAAQARLNQATAGLAGGLKRLAGGDLGFELTEAFAPDFEPLRHDLNNAVRQLSATLRSVAEAAQKIQAGTREISDSANDLSRRTEQQAASLEETAAALDQITSNVAASTRRAEDAHTESTAAARSATDSGKVVSEAVQAMNRIEQSSAQVSNIIGVIDEIAFQTNLLALNAGVEAARAGDAGKGFAVVAQEVRELAQRSAKAAKEIKELISHSSLEVQGGVKLVSETGAALETIKEYILNVNHHVEAITTAAREQSTGLSEVNTAVNQMDQVTQQNAAMVEENNASSVTLAGEAEQLLRLISQFRLGASSARSAQNDGARQAAVLRAAAGAMSIPDTAERHAPAPARPVFAKVAGGGSGADWEEF